MTNGMMCSNCGTSLTNKSGSIGLKSSNFASKLHFNIKTVDHIFDLERDTSRVTNNNYMKIRYSLVNFLFEKAILLKLSKKSVHCAALIMDIYFEKKGMNIPINDNALVAACC